MFGIASMLAVGLCLVGSAWAQGDRAMVTRDFEFVSRGRRLSGVIDEPSVKARGLIIFVHGSGATNIRRVNGFPDLRGRFAEMGIGNVVWDKPGCGRSEGVFDANRSLEESAEEVLDAIGYLRREKVPGWERIGIWSTSEGCWVAPMAISKLAKMARESQRAGDGEVRFWISVSGVPAEDNKYYLMKSNLPLEGRKPEETDRLMGEWVAGRRILLEGGDYDSYLAATVNLRKDPAVNYFAGDLTGTRNNYEAELEALKKAKEKPEFERETMSVIQVRNFKEMLGGLDVDVLALFGEKDTNVDWRRAKALYDESIGRNAKASLTVRTFPGAAHSMNESKTGSVREVEGMPMEAGVKAKGYYEAQIEWLRKYVVGK